MSLLPCLLLSSLALGGDGPEWGGFRGPNGCGVSSCTGLPDAIDVDANALWRTELPAGYSSPIVAGEHVFITASEDENLLTMALDRESGEVLWARTLEFDGKRTGANSPAAPTPVTDGERVYVMFHNVGLVAYDLAGEELWRHALGPFNIPHGMSTSPLVHGDLVIQLVDQDLDAYLVAYDKRTGEQRWRAERPGVTHSYSTPAIYAPAEGPAQVVVSGSLQIAGYALESGEKLWWVNGSSWMTKALPVFAGDLCIVAAYSPSTVEFGLPKFSQTWAEALAERDADGDGKLSKEEWNHDVLSQIWFIVDLNGDDFMDADDYAYAQLTGRATGGLFAVRMDGRGDVTETHVAWKYRDRRGLPDATTPVVLQDTLYMIKEGGLVTAIDTKSGKVTKQGRVGEPDRYYASPVAADGKVITASHGGQLAVLSGGPEWDVLSVHDLGEELWSTPAIAGGQVFVRTQEAMYCFQELTAAD